MANSDYTFEQVKNGTGAFVYESSPKASSGVRTMQLYLQQIGYNIEPDGLFGTITRDIVIAFQKETKGLTYDGSAGPATITQLDKVKNSEYFTDYGRRLDASTWSRTNMLHDYFDDVDLLSRVINAEDNTLLTAQVAVAKVIQNRSKDSTFYVPVSESSGASIWARIIAKRNAYATADTGCEACCAPPRGDTSKSDGVHSCWKQAVELAKKLSNGTNITPAKGYVVNGLTVSSTMRAVDSEMFQTTASLYKTVYNAGQLLGTAICYNSTLKGNVFYNADMTK